MNKPYREYTPEDIYNMRFEITTLKKQLDQLKAENKELKEWKKEHLKDVEFIERNPVIDILNSMADNILLEQRNEKLSKTITEIKEIAETFLTHCMGSLCDPMDDILQKISEVINE